MNCNPDSPQDRVEQPVYGATYNSSPSLDSANTALISNQEQSEIVDVRAQDSPIGDHSLPQEQTLERHNFQALELDLQLKEMSLKFKTHQSLEPQVYALLGQLSVLQSDLKEQQSQLALAHQTVGFLEAQVRVQQAQIEELRAISASIQAPKSNLLVKLLAWFASKP